MLELSGLTKSFPGAARPTLSGIDLSLGSGEYIAIMGESGSGKSTLLNLIAGLARPDRGTIRLDGVDLAGMDDDALTRLRGARMGFVFQAFHLLPHLTVAGNVALPLMLNGLDDHAHAGRVGEVLLAVGLHHRAGSLPRQLSGGEMQRVAIARALVHRPALLLADEPTGNLDRQTAQAVLDVLRETLRAHGAAGILVTHSRRAAATTDRTYELGAAGLNQLA